MEILLPTGHEFVCVVICSYAVPDGVIMITSIIMAIIMTAATDTATEPDTESCAGTKLILLLKSFVFIFLFSVSVACALYYFLSSGCLRFFPLCFLFYWSGIRSLI